MDGVSANGVLASGAVGVALFLAACGGRVLGDGGSARGDAAAPAVVEHGPMVVPTTEALRAVWGTGSSDVWAVATSLLAAPNHALVTVVPVAHLPQLQSVTLPGPWAISRRTAPQWQDASIIGASRERSARDDNHRRR